MTSAPVPASISIESHQRTAVEHTPYLLILHAGARSRSRGIRAKQREKIADGLPNHGTPLSHRPITTITTNHKTTPNDNVCSSDQGNRCNCIKTGIMTFADCWEKFNDHMRTTPAIRMARPWPRGSPIYNRPSRLPTFQTSARVQTSALSLHPFFRFPR
jgi:hypothetical protein